MKSNSITITFAIFITTMIKAFRRWTGLAGRERETFLINHQKIDAGFHLFFFLNNAWCLDVSLRRDVGTDPTHSPQLAGDSKHCFFQKQIWRRNRAFKSDVISQYGTRHKCACEKDSIWVRFQSHCLVHAVSLNSTSKEDANTVT